MTAGIVLDRPERDVGGDAGPLQGIGIVFEDDRGFSADDDPDGVGIFRERHFPAVMQGLGHGHRFLGRRGRQRIRHHGRRGKRERQLHAAQ